MNLQAEYESFYSSRLTKIDERKNEQTNPFTKLNQILGKGCLKKTHDSKNPSGKENSVPNQKLSRSIKFALTESSETECQSIRFGKSCSKLNESNMSEQNERTKKSKSKMEISEFHHNGHITAKTEEISNLIDSKFADNKKSLKEIKMDYSLNSNQLTQSGRLNSSQSSKEFNIQKQNKFEKINPNKENLEKGYESISRSNYKMNIRSNNEPYFYQNNSIKDLKKSYSFYTEASSKERVLSVKQMGDALVDSQNKKISESYLNNKNTEKELKEKGPCIDDFYLGECKGEGKFGKVFLAVHKNSGFVCALKKIKKDSVKYMMDQFIQEIKIQMFLNHPKIVKMYGYFSDDEHFYMMIEYMEEGSLYSLMKKHKKFEEREAREKMREICEGMKEMHDNNIVHRDLKPENVVLSHGVCKICDFGWAAICEDRRQTYCGTLDYVCPEIAEGESYDSGVDIWCIGILAYELMCGKAPFYDISRQKTIEKIKTAKIDNFPSFLSTSSINFIQMILQKDPEDRVGINELLNTEFLKLNTN